MGAGEGGGRSGQPHKRIKFPTRGARIMNRMLRLALVLILVSPGLVLGQGDGALVFGRCVPCHQGDGFGKAGLYPPLMTNAPELVKGSRTYLITVLLYGLEGKIAIKGQKVVYSGLMPSQYSLKDEEIAAVLNYILTSWGNDKLLPKDFRHITADEVKAERGKNLMPRQVYEIRKELRLAE